MFLVHPYSTPNTATGDPDDRRWRYYLVGVSGAPWLIRGAPYTPWIQDSLNGRRVWVRGIIEADGLPSTLIFTPPPEINYEFLSYTLTLVVE